MDDQASFREIGEGEQRLYGPRALLASGLDAGQQEHLLGLADGLGEIRVVFASKPEADRPLAELFGLPAEHGLGLEPDMPTAIIMAGLAERELHMLMAAWRKLGHTGVLWATLTPTSKSWPLSQVLTELAEEHARMQAERQGG